jgi:hypothetical protein
MKWLLNKKFSFELIRKFNDSKLLNLILVPLSWPTNFTIWFFWKIAMRVRVCLVCGKISRNIHWAKYDYVDPKTNKIVYDHIHLCSDCFYDIEK